MHRGGGPLLGERRGAPGVACAEALEGRRLSGPPRPDDAAVFDALRRHFAPGTALGAKLVGQGAVEAEASGAIVRLTDGRELIDFGSYGVTLLGHRHPAVVAAVRDQIDRMPAATRVLASPPAAALAAALAERLGPALTRVWIGSDGADAVEVAIKLARRQTGRPRVLAVEHAFHGKTLGALALTWNPAFRAGLEPLLGHVTHIRRDDVDAVAREAAAGDVAALIFEPVQGEAGALTLDLELLRHWSDCAHAAGAFVVSDEIQAGLRRCGPVSLAAEAGIAVDAVLLGKALGGGVMPLAALVATDELHATLTADPTWHTSTFGGHPLACAAGTAALDALDELAPDGERLAARLDVGLAAAARGSSVVTAVHGRGLLRALELQSPAVAGALLIELGQRGVLVSPCLGARRSIRLLPPLVTTAEQLEAAMATLDDALAAAAEYAG